MHEHIHGVLPGGIPLLSEESAKKVYRHLIDDEEELRLSKEDSIADRIEYLISLISTYCKSEKNTIAALRCELDAVSDEVDEERSPA